MKISQTVVYLFFFHFSFIFLAFCFYWVTRCWQDHDCLQQDLSSGETVCSLQRDTSPWKSKLVLSLVPIFFHQIDFSCWTFMLPSTRHAKAKTHTHTHTDTHARTCIASSKWIRQKLFLSKVKLVSDRCTYIVSRFYSQPKWYTVLTDPIFHSVVAP